MDLEDPQADDEEINHPKRGTLVGCLALRMLAHLDLDAHAAVGERRSDAECGLVILVLKTSYKTIYTVNFLVALEYEFVPLRGA